MDELDRKIYTLLKRIGVPADIDGYDYIFHAIRILVDNGYRSIPITKPGGLYDQIAARYKTMPLRVERSIRHAVELTFDRIPYTVSEQVFGATIDPMKGKLTNSDFIRQLALEIRYSN